jgi:hypothetical protein
MQIGFTQELFFNPEFNSEYLVYNIGALEERYGTKAVYQLLHFINNKKLNKASLDSYLQKEIKIYSTDNNGGSVVILEVS